MTVATQAKTDARAPRADGRRAQLLQGLPVTECRLELAGISTTVVEGGDGRPLVLLHGPGESAVNWRWVIPQLVADHRVVAPDLPAHDATEAVDPLDEDRVLAWLGELIDRTCAEPPVLVGHVLGGAIALRFARRHANRLAHLVLVDSLGLARFRPAPRFAATMAGFLVRPNERSYERFMRQCASDLDALRDRLGDEWEPFAAYNVELARAPAAKAAGRLMRSLGIPRIPPEELEQIEVPTSLIWGRDDRANRPRIAEAAGARYRWPLYVIDEAADDPIRDQPEAFVQALQAALRSPR